MRRLLLILSFLILAGLPAMYWYGRVPETCTVCQRPLHSETYFRIEWQDGSSEHVCCPQCGTRRLREVGSIPRDVRVTDFKSRGLIPAETAIYVQGSDMHLCCPDDMVRREITGHSYQRVWDRCLPSAVGFERLADANEFQQHHGGRIVGYRDLSGQQRSQ